jgi:hypothetical protein
LERTLALGGPSEERLLAVRRRIEGELAQPLLLNALRGDRAGLHDLCTKVEEGRFSGDGAELGLAEPLTRSERISNLWEIPRFREGHAQLLDALTDAVEAARLPPEQQEDEFRRIYAPATGLRPFGNLMLADLPKVWEASSRSQADLRCALVGIALEQYRRKQGRWPDRLDDLCPDLLREVPTDPFDGKPLRYRKDDQGVIVYAVGRDLTDGGGDRETLNSNRGGTDWGFRLWDADKRRQPPPLPRPEPIPGVAP